MNKHTILVIFISIFVFIILPLCILAILDKKLTLNLICTNTNRTWVKTNIYYRPIKRELLIDNLNMNEYSDKWSVKQNGKEFIIRTKRSFDYTNCSDIELNSDFYRKKCEAKLKETVYDTISIDKYTLNSYFSHHVFNTDTVEKISSGGYSSQCELVKNKI